MRFEYLLALLPTVSAVLADAFVDPPTHQFIPRWKFEPFPGVNVVLNGTIEQALAELKQINPNYSPFSSALHEPISSLRKRQRHETYQRDSVLCNNPNWGLVHVVASQVGIDYLKAVKGQPSAGPGPGNCGRVSCGYMTAVWFCNDNTHDITIESFYELAEMAAIIQYYCAIGRRTDFNGQAFHQTDNWNVVLGGAAC
ncbi:hypothetical protein CI238_01014 [Colletotrichum incanum]|uniref:Secreted protein n=1 Tax=Colletotrichum incanum TaxID=1573173 RepID=A0A166Q3N9_COLIC|nr:hypothetical protein CI238_01014 [Colletotrichum incanum]